MLNSTQPLAPCCPVFTNLENQLLCSWLQIPIHSCPWSANNYPTLCKFSHPFTPHRSNYNIYIDNIKNTSCPRQAHLHHPSFGTPSSSAHMWATVYWKESPELKCYPYISWVIANSLEPLWFSPLLAWSQGMPGRRFLPVEVQLCGTYVSSSLHNSCTCTMINWGLIAALQIGMGVKWDAIVFRDLRKTIFRSKSGLSTGSVIGRGAGVSIESSGLPTSGAARVGTSRIPSPPRCRQGVK